MNPRKLVLLTCAVLLASGCSTPVDPPQAVPEPHESEFVQGWDEPNDTPLTAAADLTADELTELLRITSSTRPHASLCTAEDLELTVSYFDAALGHRYGKLTATNTSTQACSVQGFPGFGARGEWGHKFLLVAEQADPIEYTTDQPRIRLEPGDSAYSNMEWTGSLGGAESEPIDLFLVQLANDQTPAVIHVTSPYSENNPTERNADGSPLTNASIDISMDTTVRMGPFRQD